MIQRSILLQEQSSWSIPNGFIYVLKTVIIPTLSFEKTLDLFFSKRSVKSFLCLTGGMYRIDLLFNFNFKLWINSMRKPFRWKKSSFSGVVIYPWVDQRRKISYICSSSKHLIYISLKLLDVLNTWVKMHKALIMHLESKILFETKSISKALPWAAKSC